MVHTYPQAKRLHNQVAKRTHSPQPYAIASSTLVSSDEAQSQHVLTSIREEKLLQLVLWKMVHFALFLVKISINFSPSYSTVFFSITVYVSTVQKFQNFSTMF
jgi:hypothetical protein